MTTNFSLMQHHKYSLAELENMIPFEREIYLGLLEQHIRDENDRIERENQKIEVRGIIMAAQKKLQKGSAWEKYDIDGDGVVTDEELDMERRMIDHYLMAIYHNCRQYEFPKIHKLQ